VKIAVLIARILLGLLFLVFGLNTFLHFIPMQLPPGDGGTLMGLMFQHGWFNFIGLLYVIGGALVLIGRFVPLGLVILGPIIVIILLYHCTFDPKGIGIGLIVAILAIFLIWAYREHFKPLFEPTLRKP
jgi:putative oxidoreductase